MNETEIVVPRNFQLNKKLQRNVYYLIKVQRFFSGTQMVNSERQFYKLTQKHSTNAEIFKSTHTR